MKRLTLLALLLSTTLSHATTNVLELTWAQPPGYGSTLFTSTNLAGAWSTMSTNPPPFTTVSDKSVAFFYVVVAPTNKYPLAGSGEPTFAAPAGSIYIGTNDPVSLWFKVSDDGSSGWVQGI